MEKKTNGFRSKASVVLARIVQIKGESDSACLGEILWSLFVQRCCFYFIFRRSMWAESWKDRAKSKVAFGFMSVNEPSDSQH